MHFLPVQIFAWLCALAWATKLVECAIGIPRVPDLLAPEYDRTPPGTPLLYVIVPARDEVAAIVTALQSLLQQDYPNLRVIAVDDRSTDGTGEAIDHLAETHPERLVARHLTELPAGWLGKTHAMATGAAQAIESGAELLLFTDADVVFSPEILRRTLAQMASTGADHFVVLPTTVAHTRGEAMMLAMLHVLGLFSVRPWLVASSRSRDAIGIGAFNLIRSSAYRQIGGFEALRLEIVEDLALGRRVKAAGLRQQAAYAPGAVSLHWAPGLLGVLHGLTKNLYAVFGFRPVLLLGAAVGLVLVWIAPFVLVCLPGLRLPGAIAVGSLVGLYLLVGRKSRISAVWAACAPLAAGLLVYSMVRSMVVTLAQGGITWRGTFYPLRLVQQQPRSGKRAR